MNCWNRNDGLEFGGSSLAGYHLDEGACSLYRLAVEQHLSASTSSTCLFPAKINFYGKVLKFATALSTQTGFTITAMFVFG